VIKFSLRSQFVVFFFLLILVPFLAVGYIAYAKSVQAIRDVNMIASQDMIKKNGVNLDNYLETTNSIHNDIMFSSSMQQLLNTVPQSPLEELRFTDELMRLMNSLNTNRFAYSLRIFPIVMEGNSSFYRTLYHGLNVEQEAWYQRAKQNLPPSWQLFLPSDNPALYPEPIISRVKRLYSFSRKEITGVVLMDIKISALRNYLSPLQLDEAQQIMLLDERNTVLYNANPDMLGTVIQDKGLISFIAADKTGAAEITMDGVKQIVSFTTINSYKWKLVSVIPLSRLTRNVSLLGNMNLFFLVFYLLLCGFTIFFITIRFTNPVQKLVKGMRKIGEMDNSEYASYFKRADEIGWLYRAYYQLTGRIDQLVANAETEAQKKKELELQVLTHQINPHFLYNTLESIRWKAEDSNAGQVGEMVSALGQLLRLSLNDGNELTTVEREVEHVRAYVKIQSARFDSLIRVVYLIDENMMQQRCLRLILQPIVENSIKHGNRQRSAEGVKIIIKGTLADDCIRFEISDNGPGVPEALCGVWHSGKNTGNIRQGVGLHNVSERFRIYFGKHDALSVHNAETGGAVVRLDHPFVQP